MKGFRGRSSALTRRVAGLESAIESGRGRLPEALLNDAAKVAERVQGRLLLSPEHTIVALAGATGSGKSSLFNRLTGLDLAAVGVRRPTTSWALACAWPPAGAEEILTWLGIPARHQVARTSHLDGRDYEANMEGLVLLDLPDHDSTEVSHHLEVERLVEYADLVVWVLDPQKYADAAVHDRFLRPLASHSEVMMVVLNQVDRIADKQRTTTLDDVRRLLTNDGLGGIPLLASSATTGDGIDGLRKELRNRIASKGTARERLGADIGVAAEELAVANGSGPPTTMDRDVQGRLTNALATAAGVPMVVQAIERSAREQARRLAGWPGTRWLARLRPDPLKDLGLDRDAASLVRSSVPEPSPVQKAAVDMAVRDVADSASVGLTKPWAGAVRRASSPDRTELRDALDQAIVGTDLGAGRAAWWWRGVNMVQWALFAAAIVGIGWLAVLAGLSFLQVSPGTPLVSGVPAPTLLLLVGLVLGIGLGLLSRAVAGRSGSRRARKAQQRMHAAIAVVAAERVLDPIQAELAAYERVRAGISAARG